MGEAAGPRSAYQWHVLVPGPERIKVEAESRAACS